MLMLTALYVQTLNTINWYIAHKKKNNKMDMMLRHQLVPRRFPVSRGTYDIPASENAVLAIIGKSFVCACICD